MDRSLSTKGRPQGQILGIGSEDGSLLRMKEEKRFLRLSKIFPRSISTSKRKDKEVEPLSVWKRGLLPMLG